MKKTLIGAAAVALGALAFAVPAQAAVSIHTDLSGWDKVAGAHAELVDDGVKLTTTDNADKVTWRTNVNFKLSALTTAQYETQRLGGSNDTALPAFHLYIDVDNDTDTDTTLIFEPYWQGPGGSVLAPTGATHTWDVAAGYFWSSKTTEDDKLKAGAGGPPFYTLAQVKEFYPNAKLRGYGVGQGSYNANTVTRVNHVKLNSTTNNWTLKSVTAEAPDYTKPTCTATGVVKSKTTDGVKYVATRNVVAGVTVSATVTATAETGHVLKGAVDGKVVFGPYDVAKLPATDDDCKQSPSPSPSTSSPTATPSQSTTGAPTPSDTESTPVGASLPVTGDGGGVNKPLVFTAGGIAMIAAGGIILLVLRRRRDAVSFTA